MAGRESELRISFECFILSQRLVTFIKKKFHQESFVYFLLSKIKMCKIEQIFKNKKQ